MEKLSDHRYGGYHPYIGKSCLCIGATASRSNEPAIPYGAYEVEGQTLLAIAYYDATSNQVFGMSGVKPKDLLVMDTDSLEAKEVYHRVIAGLLEWKARTRMELAER